MENKKSSRVGLWVVTILFISVIVLTYWQRYWLFDTYRLRGYQPSAAVASLANETTLQSNARRMFYAHHPELQDKSAFVSSCTVTEKTIVLGCFVSREGIYLFNVTDTRLHGVMEVTAAHEVLHAGYERLNPYEKKRINLMLDQAYDSLKNDRVKKTIDSYRDSGADISNELHSILGTEVKTLPTDLEEYYKRYFIDRSKVVVFAETYQAEFEKRQEQVAAFDAELTQMKPQIEQSTKDLTSRSATINQQYNKLIALRSQGNIAAYNTAVPTYNQQVSEYNKEVNRVQSLIEQYNTIVGKRNDLATEENELSKAIDSRPEEITTQ